MPRLLINKVLEGHGLGKEYLSITVGNLTEFPSHIESNYPTVYRLIFDEHKHMNGYVRLLLNDELINEFHDRVLLETDTLEFIVALAGG